MHSLGWVRRLHRNPWLHFIGIGLLLYFLPGPWSSRAAPEPLQIEGEQVRSLTVDWLRRTGRYPNSEELKSLVRDALDKKLLFQEGLRLGLHLSDPLVWRRLVRNMRFLGVQGEDYDLLRQALDLGMHRRDVVVQRRVLQMMEERHRSFVLEPSEEELLQQYYSEQEKYRRVRVAFLHLFFSRQQRGMAAAYQAAEQWMGDCRVELFDSTHGDPHPAGLRQPLQTEEQIAKNFGGHFASRVLAGGEGACLGPVESAYGVHWVLIAERESEVIPYAQLHERLREEKLRERAFRSLGVELDKLREKHGVHEAGILAAIQDAQE